MGLKPGATLDSSQTFLGVTDGLGQVHALEQTVVSSESSLVSKRRECQVRIRTSIVVLNTQQQTYGAKRDLAKACYSTDHKSVAAARRDRSVEPEHTCGD